MAQACVTHTHTQAGVPKHPDMLTHSCLFIPTRGDHTLTVQLIHRDMYSHTQEALKGTDAHADTWTHTDTLLCTLSDTPSLNNTSTWTHAHMQVDTQTYTRSLPGSHVIYSHRVKPLILTQTCTQTHTRTLPRTLTHYHTSPHRDTLVHNPVTMKGARQGLHGGGFEFGLEGESSDLSSDEPSRCGRHRSGP